MESFYLSGVFIKNEVSANKCLSISADHCVHTWTGANMKTRLLMCVALAGAHTCLQFMTERLKREVIKTKYVCLTVLPLRPPRAVAESLGATYHAGRL